MRIAVFSDSHGDTAGMIRAVELYRPELIVHLGDCVRDARELAGCFYTIPMISVRGNCDYAPETEETVTVQEDGVTIFMTHGHSYGVKLGLDALLNSVGFSGAQLGLFGHTHMAMQRALGVVTLLNPGRAGRGLHPTWASVDTDGRGGFECRIRDI